MRAVSALSLSVHADKRRVEELFANDGHEIYTVLVSVVDDLLPKFEQIYRATGNGLVRNERGYSDFNRLGAYGRPSQRETHTSHKALAHPQTCHYSHHARKGATRLRATQTRGRVWARRGRRV